MDKIRILIVEDDEYYADQLVEYLTSNGMEVTEVARDLKDALGFFYSQQPDLVIVDIYLDGQPDGIVFAQTINENPNTSKPFLFLTEHADSETFKNAKLTAPFSYLIKPFNPIELQYTIELTLEKFAGERGIFSSENQSTLIMENTLFVKRGNSLVKVAVKDVEYVEVEGKYSKVVADSSSFLVSWPLKKIILKLSAFQFIQVHRNFIVNLHAVKSVHLADQQVILKNEKSVPFSRNFRENLISRLDILK